MGRKRKYSLGIWLTENEMSRLKNKVSKSKLNQSEYIRTCILNKKITVAPGIGDLIIEIKRIGNNLNQLTRSVNQGKLRVLGESLKSIKKDLTKVWAQLAETLSRI